MHSGFGFADITTVRDERSRAITPENPDGARGGGGKATHDRLGPGRKGRPTVTLPAGETTPLADIEGPGEIRHIWMTVPPESVAGNPYRDLVLRAYWNDEDDPSVEVPLGDFFCLGHGRRCTVTSMPIVVAPEGGLNTFFPMPFGEHATLTLESELDDDIRLWYQVDYALVPELPADTAYFHAGWRRENPTTRGEDVTVVETIEGEGHYVGTYLAWAALERGWWGEGEVKFYIDGDEYPTICGTGTEDYPGGAFGFGNETTYSTPFMGFPQHEPGDEREVPRHGLYRWHIPDPIRFTEELRVTVQAIGQNETGLFERQDDVAATSYWYQREPHAPFPTFPGRAARRPR